MLFSIKLLIFAIFVRRIAEECLRAARSQGGGVGEQRDCFFGLGVSLGIHNQTLLFQGLGELLTRFARSRPLVTSTFFRFMRTIFSPTQSL